MEVFISWSGSRSKHIAESFRSWLGLVIQSIEPWISPDIEKGLRWTAELSEKLEKVKIGIICLTKENLTAPWLLFEAGALSKINADYVCTFLYDLVPGDIDLPLAQFQHTENKKNDIFKLVCTINNASPKFGERSLTDSTLQKAFDAYWGQLEGELKKTPSSNVHTKSPAKDEKDMLREILETIRYQHFVLEDIRKNVVPKFGGFAGLQQAALQSRLEVPKQDALISLMGHLKSISEQLESAQRSKILSKGIESGEAVGTPAVEKADK